MHHVHGNLAIQAVPGELLFCHGMAFAIKELLVLRKNVVDKLKTSELQSGLHKQFQDNLVH